MKICDACGKPVNGGISMGGALICRECNYDVITEMEELRAAGKPVNVLHIAKRKFREINGEPGVLQIRDVPAELREQMNRAAFEKKISLRELVLRALYRYFD
jgi:hypothetical protein